MTPATRIPSAAMDQFQARPFHRLDAMFDRMFGEDGSGRSAASGPPLAIWEDEDRFHLEVELPGFAEPDVDITVHKGVLALRAERKPQEGRTYLYNNRLYGRFERTIQLPETVGTDDVQATLADGVLHIVLTKAPEAKPKKIALTRTSS